MKRLLLPLLAALALPTAVNAEIITTIDDFENSTTSFLMISSKNKMLFDSSMAMINPMLARSVRNGEKSYAYLELTCKKYADNYNFSESEVILNPSAPIKNINTVKLKFDNLPPVPTNLSKERGIDEYSFWNTKDLIKRLYAHSTLKIKYQTTRGPQIAEFVLDNKKEIAEFWEKCY
tara:strand:+ start:136 stop:666 length:531 start_codon:yes stop_codon:yes gene_type:complete